jgi:hypothetical protein
MFSTRPSLDHLVCASEQRRRHVEAKCLCRVEVDHKLKSGWQQKRQVGGLCALEYFCSVDACLPIRIGNAG